MTLKNNRAPLLCYFKALFSISWPLVNSNWSYSGITKSGSKSIFLSPVTLTFDRWPSTLGNSPKHYQSIWIISSSYMNSNVSYTSEVPDVGQIRRFLRATWPWNLTDDLPVGTPNLGQIRRFLEPCDLEIWRMTLKNNRAPLPSIIKLYAWFHHHMWIQTGVTVRKRLICWVVTSVTLTFDLDLLHVRHFCHW